jgi:superfamily II DNA or RNA helicase
MVFKPYLKFPVVDHYVNTKRLKYYADQVLVTMEFERDTVRHDETIICNYDKDIYKRVLKDRWDPYENCPIEETGKLCYLLRRVSNDDTHRYVQTLETARYHGEVIIFYNFTYELHRLREIFSKDGFIVKEWNGERHEPLPEGDKWVYLVQYTAGCEGWNAITTDTMIFFSQNYSYKITEQAAGRIDRLNTPFKDLYYYHLRSASPIDIAIKRALNQKRTFNEKIFMKGVTYNGGT